MRDLTLDECELVNGGKTIMEEIAEALGNMWQSFNHPAAPSGGSQPFSPGEGASMYAACLNAIAQGGNGGTATIYLNSATVNASGFVEVPLSVSGGAANGSVVCVINPSTGKAIVR